VQRWSNDIIKVIVGSDIHNSSTVDRKDNINPLQLAFPLRSSKATNGDKSKRDAHPPDIPYIIIHAKKVKCCVVAV